MPIEEAAKLLKDRLRDAPWVTAVGVGSHDDSACVFLYVTTLRDAELGFLADGWHGFPVVVRKMGTPRPLRVFRPATASRKTPAKAV